MGLALESNYVLMICQAGAEQALKEEVGRDLPALRPAFSRPGFVTFKSDHPVRMEAEMDFVFARRWALSLGRGKSPEEIAEKIQSHGLTPPLRLQVFERLAHLPGEEPLGWKPDPSVKAFESKLRSILPSYFKIGGTARPGETVLDVVLVDPEQWWWGLHFHRSGRSPHPGGQFPAVLPAQSPSRAWLKLEEMIEWAQVPLTRGEVAVEIGSAPGGAALSLLQRGLKVLGIDPGAMAPQVLGFKGGAYRHLSMSVSQLIPSDLPPQVDWLLLDMNADPDVSLDFALRVKDMRPDSIQGVLFTLKLNQWDFSRRVPEYLALLKSCGLSKLRAAQLSTHRREIGVFGLVRRASPSKNVITPKK